MLNQHCSHLKMDPPQITDASYSNPGNGNPNYGATNSH